MRTPGCLTRLFSCVQGTNKEKAKEETEEKTLVLFEATDSFRETRVSKSVSFSAGTKDYDGELSQADTIVLESYKKQFAVVEMSFFSLEYELSIILCCKFINRVNDYIANNLNPSQYYGLKNNLLELIKKATACQMNSYHKFILQPNQEKLKVGNRYFVESRYQKAICVYEGIIKSLDFPLDSFSGLKGIQDLLKEISKLRASCFVNLGNCYKRTRDVVAAKTCYQKALEFDEQVAQRKF